MTRAHRRIILWICIVLAWEVVLPLKDLALIAHTNSGGQTMLTAKTLIWMVPISISPNICFSPRLSFIFNCFCVKASNFKEIVQNLEQITVKEVEGL